VSINALTEEPLTADESAYYTELARYLTDPGTVLGGVGPARRGAEAAAAGRALLLRDHRDEEALAAAVRRGELHEECAEVLREELRRRRQPLG
jgi:hypothetical protein